MSPFRCTFRTNKSLKNSIESPFCRGTQKSGYFVLIRLLCIALSGRMKDAVIRQVVGFCRLLRSSSKRDVTLDFPWFEDVTLVGETEESVSEEIMKELRFLSEKIQSSASTIASVFSDSASCNFGARGLLSLKLPELCFTTSFLHQPNPVAGHVLTHESITRTTNQAKAIVPFFNCSLSSGHFIKLL